MKKTICTSLICALALSSTALAAGKTLSVGGEKYDIAGSYTSGKTLMLPVRSIAEKLGFTCVGREPHTAYKFGWVGLSTWWLPLRKGNAAPEKTHPIPAEQLAAILKKYSA